MSTYIGNVRITTNDIIKNWWKLGYFDSGQITRDNGEGDVDFYTYWYSIAYVLGMVNVYRRIFRDVDSYETVLRKFFQSREIAIKNDDSLNTLEYIFENYLEDLKRRGTKNINRYFRQSFEIGFSDYVSSGDVGTDISDNAGIGVISNTYDLVGSLSVVINLGLYHSIEFDVLFSNEGGVPYIVGGVGTGALLVDTSVNSVSMALTPGTPITSCIFTYSCGGFDYSFTVSVDVTGLNKVKFLRYESFVVFYLNDEYVGRETILLNDALEYDVYSFDRLFTADLPAIANIVTKKRDEEFIVTNVYSWLCCEGSGCNLDSNHAPDYCAVLDVINSTLWDDVWRRSVLFSNTDFVGVDGESRRLVDYTYGEHLLEMINASEMGWAMDISSPISEEASCVNLNKAYQRGVITHVSKFPITFSSSVRPFVYNEYIRFSLPAYNIDLYGLNVSLLSSGNWRNPNFKPISQTPFIPISVANYGDNLDGYEVSFVINSSRNIRLYFSILTYDVELNLVVAKTKRYSDDTFRNSFISSVNFDLCEGRDLWVRGVYSLSKLTGVSNNLNINTGDNLYSADTDSEIAYIAPIIAFSAVGSYAITVDIKDIVVRPLTLNTEKGVVSNKNKVVGYMKNRSGKSDTFVQSFVRNKLIPYNCVTNIQFL